jgi:hypothetical protein
MEALKTTLTDNALTRYYEERIVYLEGENERLRNETRADFWIVLDFWIYSQRMIQAYVSWHTEAKHNHYLDCIKTMLETLEAHETRVLDTAINKLRIEVIACCKIAIIKCEQITAAR